MWLWPNKVMCLTIAGIVFWSQRSFLGYMYMHSVYETSCFFSATVVLKPLVAFGSGLVWLISVRSVTVQPFFFYLCKDISFEPCNNHDYLAAFVINCRVRLHVPLFVFVARYCVSFLFITAICLLILSLALYSCTVFSLKAVQCIFWGFKDTPNLRGATFAKFVFFRSN